MSQNNEFLSVLEEGYSRLQGRDVLTANVTAARSLGTAVRTTLGPKGRDKLLVDSLGDIVVTNDGATILQEIDIDHPVAQMIVDVAHTQNAEVGDGTTTATILSSELLRQALELLEQGLHPSVIVAGYTRAAGEAIELSEDASFSADTNDVRSVVETSVNGRRTHAGQEHLVELIHGAVERVGVENASDPDVIQVETIPGGTLTESEVIDGVIIDQTPSHQSMPNRIETASVAIIDGELTTGRDDFDANVIAESATVVDALAERDQQVLAESVEHLVTHDVDILFVSGEVDSYALDLLAHEGILAVKQCPDEAIERIERATGATIVSQATAIQERSLGYAGRVEVGGTEHESHLFIEACEHPEYITILLRGGTEHVLDEAQRVVADGIAGAAALVDQERICVGGGASEMVAATGLRRMSNNVGGRQQLAVKAFADALESIPWTLAENAGADPVDALIELRNEYDEGATTIGINSTTGQVEDLQISGVFEPLAMKTAAINSATEATNMILRIDDFLIAEELPDMQGQNVAD